LLFSIKERRLLMKIYPSTHNITQTEKIDLDIDIPLAYVDTKFTDYKVDVVPYLSSSMTKEVIPYSTFNSLDVKLFDKYNNEINVGEILQRNGEGYYYIPKDATSFVPQRFNYKAIGKKSIKYNTTKQYNLRVSCVDNSTDLAFAKRMIKAFGDAPKRGICPTNISVNSQDLSFYSLLDSSIEENDIVLIETKDGKTYDGEVAIDFDSYLSKCTNMWLSIEDSEKYPVIVSEEELSCQLKSPKVMNSENIKYKHGFEINTNIDSEVIYHNLFDTQNIPVMIIEHPRKGFVIVSHKSFLEELEKNINLFYEIMTYVYFNTYVASSFINEWIADVMPDYIVSDNKLNKKNKESKFTSNIELQHIFNLGQTEISLADIFIDNDNVRYVGISNNYIVFDKIKKGEDPSKPPGSISVFTPRQNIIYYNDFIYEIEDSIYDKIEHSKAGESIWVSIKPLKHSKMNINLKEETSLEIPLYMTVDYKEEKLKAIDVCIVFKDNVIGKVSKQEYKEDSHGQIVAEIRIYQSEEYSNMFDMRQRGGGLSEDEEPDFNLLDIGHIFGRPYRKGGTLIITLPKKLEQHEALIEQAIKKHMIAEDLPILIFE
jgi:hypothetical protein